MKTPIKNSQVARRNDILKGYAAFNDGDRTVLEELFCDDFTDKDGNDFPAWHLMNGTGTKRGKARILDYLVDELRPGNPSAGIASTEAEFVDAISDGNTSIAIDFTHGSPEGNHACADKILFDDDGRIVEVWHCASDTHGNGHSGHPQGHPHQ